ncbi:MAG: hypothetical protein NC434_03545 [Ruminococcus sp.]|nr:hypothetical protein [Ruminococcus sp.]
MLSVILIWIYIITTVFLLGYGILTGLTHLCPYQIKRWDSYLMCGLAGVTVYAQFFSIFAPVGAAANAILIIICLLIALICRKKLRTDWQYALERLREEKDQAGKKDSADKAGKRLFVKILAGCFLFLLFAYGTSRGIMHYDTALYHAQSIRWIEEYGVVKGLGNLHCRLAYNSASFALTALYGMAFMGGQSFHCTAGFLALLLAGVCCELISLVKRKYLLPSDFARVMAIYYLLIIFDEMVSPASDYFMVLTAFYIVIRFLDLLEEKEKAVFPYAMLCVLGVFLLTLKLSAALLILLTLKPAIVLIREKRWKEIMLYLGLGILTAAPFLIRNVLISGWLVYPFTGIDLFAVDWKIPEGTAAYDAREIQVWGRGYTDVLLYDMPIKDWFPAWFKSVGGLDKVFLLLALAAVPVYIGRLLYGLVCGLSHKNNSSYEKGGFREHLLPEGVLVVCFLFWLLSSPLLRYGCVYVYLSAAVVWGDMLTEFLTVRAEKDGYGKYVVRIGKLCIGVFLLYKAAAFGREIIVLYNNTDYWFCQEDYEEYPTEDYKIADVTFYYSSEGDRTGYRSFPSSPTKAQIGLRGESLRDGFYYSGE